MVWFQTCDTILQHPKSIELDQHPRRHSAWNLWHKAGVWSAQQLTDGRIPRALVSRLDFDEADAQALVDVGFWRVLPDGNWYFSGWDKCQQTRKDVHARRKAERERKARYRQRKKGSDVPVGQAVGQDGGTPRTRDALLTKPNQAYPNQEKKELPSSPATAEFREAWAAAWFSLGETPPELRGRWLEAAVSRASAHSQAHGVTLAEAARQLAIAAREHASRTRDGIEQATRHCTLARPAKIVALPDLE